MKTGTLDLIDVYDDNNKECVSSTGEHLYTLRLKTLSAFDIPLSNFVGFAADGASNQMGDHNSLASLLRADLPGITIFRCICHSIH